MNVSRGKYNSDIMERKKKRRGKAIESNVARAKDLTERKRKQTQSQKNILLHRRQN